MANPTYRTWQSSDKKASWDRWSETQPRPYISPLPFEYISRRIQMAYGNSQGTTASSLPNITSHVNGSYYDRLYAKVYQQFVGKMKADSASLLVTLSERQKSIDMIRYRALQLAAGILAAKQGNVRALRRHWGSHAGVRRRVKAAGGHVLEYSFGWAPLVGDIVNAVKTVSNGVPPSRIKTSARVSWVSVDKSTTSTSKFVRVRRYDLKLQLGADVAISSPFLALANQLGLLNPAMVAYERTPWSFVLNYFVNIDTWLGSFTDFVGYSVLNSYCTAGVLRYTQEHIVGNNDYPLKPSGFTGETFAVKRTLGISSPKLVVRLPWRMSVQRASTSIGLLTQRLKT